jgi:hypothetical protein
VVSPRRQERVDELREALADGTRLDQIEELARQRFGLSQRAARRHVLELMRQLEEDGERIRQGTHELQALTLAMRRRDLLAEMAARKKDVALLKDLEIERCKLLGLYAKDRCDALKPPSEEEDGRTAERMIEIEFARLDRARGIRHTVSETIAGPNGEPNVPGRQPFKPPVPEDWDPDSPYPSVENDDWLTRDLGPDWTTRCGRTTTTTFLRQPRRHPANSRREETGSGAFFAGCTLTREKRGREPFSRAVRSPLRRTGRREKGSRPLAAGVSRDRGSCVSLLSYTVYAVTYRRANFVAPTREASANPT